MKKGFTLIEMLLALAILTLVVTGVYAAFRTGRRAWARGTERADLFQKGRICLDGLMKELRCAYIARGSSSIYFSGKGAEEKDEPFDELTFCYVKQPPGWGAPGYDLRRVSYKCAADEKGSGVRRLLRAEEMFPFSGADDAIEGAGADQPETRTVVMPSGNKESAEEDLDWAEVTDSVTDFSCSFLTESGWTDEWGSTAALPRAVEITLEVAGGEDRVKFVTQAKLPAGGMELAALTARAPGALPPAGAPVPGMPGEGGIPGGGMMSMPPGSDYPQFPQGPGLPPVPPGAGYPPFPPGEGYPVEPYTGE